jgi:flagellar export protein FliJ
MAFRFALAPLLRLRRSVEHQRALALQQASFHVARARDVLAQLEKFLDDSLRADARALAAGRTAAELQFATLLRAQLEQIRVQAQDEITRLETLRIEAARAYRHALREREALETLCARQRRAYQLEQRRRQQQEVDAAFLLQRWHVRKD